MEKDALSEEDAMHVDRQIENDLRISVVGIGGAGGNAINSMVDSGLTGVRFIATNTDHASLNSSKAQTKIRQNRKRGKQLPFISRKKRNQSRLFPWTMRILRIFNYPE